MALKLLLGSQYRHCEPTGRANARPMTGSAKQSISPRKERMDCFVASLLSMTTKRSRHEFERHAAKLKPVAGHRTALRLGGIAHLGDVGDFKRQPAHQIACALHKTKTAIGQFQ